MTRPFLRIAHAAGNRAHWTAAALDAGADYVEADLRWWHGRVWVRHEHRLGPLPLLYNVRVSPSHRRGPLGLSLGPLWLRADTNRRTLGRLLEQAARRAGLMLDFKAERLPAAERERFVRAVLVQIDGFDSPRPVDFCGDWRFLDLVCRLRVGQRVYYSVDNDGDWARLLARIERHAAPPAITLKRVLLDRGRAAILHEHGIPFVAWDVHTRAEADAAIAAGAEGVIAGDLTLLASLPATLREAG